MRRSSHGRKVVSLLSNRLASSNDITDGVNVATYAWANNRLVRRTFGNGAVAHIDYESAGCGCGGFSAFVESIRHEDAAQNVLFREERRYDLLGNVTACRREHQGGQGEVHRYDDAYRLTDSYRAVDLSGGGLDALADPAQPVTGFALRRNYALDTRGNRTGVTETDGLGNPVRNISYSADDLTNQYEQIDGETFLYDAIEQQTYDPTTGLYAAYDYKGNRVVLDDDADFSTPERRFSYDTHARLRLEQRFYEASYHTMDTNVGLCAPTGQKGGSCASMAEQRLEEVRWSGEYPGTAEPGTQYTYGPGTSHNGPVKVLEKVGSSTWRWRHEDPLGSLLGMTDPLGYRVAEFTYDEYGEVARQAILWDGASRVTGAEAPGGGHPDDLRILTTEEPLDDLVGALGRVTLNGGLWTSFVSATGYDELLSSWYVDMEAMGAWEAALSAINTGTGILTVFESYDATLNASMPHTAGRWTAVSYNSMSNTTTLTQDDGDPGSLIPSFAAGWRVQVDANLAYAFPVLAVSGDSVIVAGDMTNLAAIDGVYALISPANIDSSTGAVQTDPLAKESRYLFAGYRHLPAVAGFYTDPDGPGGLPLAVYGTQPGGNFSGDYHCWHRVYSPTQGRWTSPDPAKSPWWNLADYVAASPVNHTDPTGLETVYYEVGIGTPYKGEGDNEWCVNIHVYTEMEPENLQQELFTMSMDDMYRKIFPIKISDWEVLDDDTCIDDTIAEDEYTLVEKLAGETDKLKFKVGEVETEGNHAGMRHWVAKFCQKLDFSGTGDNADVKFKITLKVERPDFNNIVKKPKNPFKLTSMKRDTDTFKLQSNVAKDVE